MSWPIFDISPAPPYQQVFDYTGSPDGVQPIYAGMATCGALSSDTKWKIRKFTYASDGAGGFRVTNIQFCNGDTGYRQVWNTNGVSILGCPFLNASAVFK
jgi:hypothetical protein